MMPSEQGAPEPGSGRDSFEPDTPGQNSSEQASAGQVNPDRARPHQDPVDETNTLQAKSGQQSGGRARAGQTRSDQPKSLRARWRLWRRAAEGGTRSLLDRLADGDPTDQILLGDLLTGLGRRAFGVLLFLAIPPAFIPGVASFISSPIVVLVGLQLIGGLRRPWLPDWLARRGPHRSVLIAFDRWFSPWLARLERLVRARNTRFLDHRFANFFSGVLLVLLGVLLALPIPLTNGLFGVLLLLFALALLERDGSLMLIAWIAGAIAITIFGILSGNLAALAAHWIEKLLSGGLF